LNSSEGHVHTRRRQLQQGFFQTMTGHFAHEIGKFAAGMLEKTEIRTARALVNQRTSEFEKSPGARIEEFLYFFFGAFQRNPLAKEPRQGGSHSQSLFDAEPIRSELMAIP
jgi:hypothetical protein